jgi:hypothetical protein
MMQPGKPKTKEHAMKVSKFVAVAATVAAFSAAAAADASAQACFGTPTIQGQRAISAGVGFPEGGTNYHARLDVNQGGPLSYQLNYAHTAPNGVGTRVNTVGGGVAYELPSAVVPGRVAVTGCPIVGASYAMVGGDIDQNRLDVPLGFGLGARASIGAGVTLAPYVQPQFVVSRTTNRVDGQTVATTDHGFGATVGSALDFGPFYTAVDYTTTRWNDVPAADNRLGVRVGVKF